MPLCMLVVQKKKYKTICFKCLPIISNTTNIWKTIHGIIILKCVFVVKIY